MNPVNTTANPCVVCGKMVWPEQGFILRRDTYCSECVDKPKPSVIGFSMSKEGGILIRPQSFLGEERFSMYRKLLDGASYSSEKKCHITSMDNVESILTRLVDAGFRTQVDEIVQNKISILKKQRTEQLWQAKRRLDAISEELARKGLALYDYQRKGVGFLSKKKNALLADQMGLGKTVQAIIAIPDNVPVVVVCPSVAKGVWQKEIEKWRSDLRPIILSGRNSFFWPSAGQVVILNYDILPEIETIESEGNLCDVLPLQLMRDTPEGVVLIADEAHYLKSSSSNRGKQFAAISEIVREQNGRVWLITGTPILNSPEELWNILSIADLAREAFGSFTQFAKMHQVPIDEEGKICRDGYGNILWGKPTPEVSDRIQRVCIRRFRKDVLPELPEKRYRSLFVDVKRQTKQWLEQIPEDVADRWIQESLRKGMDVGELSEARKILAEEKMKFVISMIEEFEDQNEPIVVFSAHRYPIEQIGSRIGWKKIMGGVEAEERKEIEEEFQAGKYKGIAATITAAGVALTLTRANQAIFIDRTFTSGMNEQAEDRICRVGQKRGVIINDIVANCHLDKRLYAVLSNKKELTSLTIG